MATILTLQYFKISMFILAFSAVFYIVLVGFTVSNSMQRYTVIESIDILGVDIERAQSSLFLHQKLSHELIGSRKNNSYALFDVIERTDNVAQQRTYTASIF